MSVGVRQVGGITLPGLKRQIDAVADGRLRQKLVGALGRELAASHREAFAQEASPSGVPWAPLKRPRPGRKLHVSGALERAATRPVFRGNTVAFLLPAYAARQNFGYPRGALNNPPPRPFLALDPLPFSTQQRIARAMGDVVNAYFA